DVEMVEVNFSAQIKDIHAGNTGALTPMSVAVSYYSDNMGSNRIDVPADSYTVGTDGSVTVTNAVITLPAGRFNTDNKLSLTLNIDSIWTIKIADSNIEAGRTSASVSAVAEYIPPEQQSYMLLLDTTDVGLVYNIPAAVDMELLSVSMTYNNTTGLNEIPIAGGELVQIIYQFTGQVDTDALAINAQITPSITGSAIIYDTAIPGAGNVYTDAAPLSIILEYQVPEMVTSDITLTPHCEIFNQA
ncbi:MAG: hypothetical protein J6K80_02855, partial [Oscillospiraceae bacterium]|nr:hypothetical protein [Oscillospiraceae bacterium]